MRSVGRSPLESIQQVAPRESGPAGVPEDFGALIWTRALVATGPNCPQARQPYTLGVAGHSMASRPDLQQSLSATRADRRFFGHPRGLATLFFTEMWERFSYYGMRALLILFMTAGVATGGLGFSYAKAGAI